MPASALPRRAVARVVIAFAYLVGLAALPARADDALATFFAKVFAQPLPPQPGIIKPLRRAARERAQGTQFASALFTSSNEVEKSYAPSSVMVASFYGAGERLSSHTASGERFNRFGLTAAHRTLPFGTRMMVCLAACVTVRINDRGPFVRGRSLDLAYGAARAIGLRSTGRVRVAVLG